MAFRVKLIELVTRILITV